MSLYTPWYRLMNHYERGEWNKCLPIARQLHLTEQDLITAYAKALEWSASFFGRA
jgi:c-di-GMP-related signal transduction protein